MVSTRTAQYSVLLTEELLDESASSLTLDDDDHACAQPLAPWRASGCACAALCACDADGVKHDAIAGLTVGVVLIPQGMAYGVLAGLSPVYGLYCGLAPLLAYGALGSSAHLSIGPFALVSLLTREAAENVCLASGRCDDDDDAGYVAAVLALSLATGLWQLALAGLGAGELVSSVLADSVMHGFTTASAVLIATSQAQHAVGLSVKAASRAKTLASKFAPLVCEHSDFAKQWLTVFVAFPDWNYSALATFSCSAALLVTMRFLKKRGWIWKHAPEQLCVMALATALSAALHWKAHLLVVGVLPSGLPPFTVPQSFAKLGGQKALAPLLKGAFTIATVAFVLSLAVARALAAKFATPESVARGGADAIAPRRELLALGAANVLGSFFGAYPSAGSLSRSAVAADAGARTAKHNLVSAAVVAVALLALTRLFAALPYATLSAIVAVSLLPLLEFGECRRLRAMGFRADSVLWALAFVATLFLGVQLGLAAGVLASLAYVAVKASRPPVTRLGRLDGRPDVYRDLSRRSRARTSAFAASALESIAIVRYGGALHFASRNYFAANLRAARAHSVSVVVLDCSSVSSVDSSGEATLRELVREFDAAKVALVLACARGSLRDVLGSSRFYDALPPSRVFATLHDAVVFAESLAERRAREDRTIGDSQTTRDAPSDGEIELEEIGLQAV